MAKFTSCVYHTDQASWLRVKEGRMMRYSQIVGPGGLSSNFEISATRPYRFTRLLFGQYNAMMSFGREIRGQVFILYESSPPKICKSLIHFTYGIHDSVLSIIYSLLRTRSIRFQSTQSAHNPNSSNPKNEEK